MIQKTQQKDNEPKKPHDMKTGSQQAATRLYKDQNLCILHYEINSTSKIQIIVYINKNPPCQSPMRSR